MVKGYFAIAAGLSIIFIGGNAIYKRNLEDAAAIAAEDAKRIEKVQIPIVEIPNMVYYSVTFDKDTKSLTVTYKEK